LSVVISWAKTKKYEKHITAFLAITLRFTSCKEEKKKENLPENNSQFATLLKDYSEGKLRLNPADASFIGDHRFDASFPNLLSDDYRKEYDIFYTTYVSKLDSFKDVNLTESEQMSKAVMAWDCEMALAQASFKNHLLMLFDQLSTVNLTMTQWATGTSAQPFKTVESYNNWLKRLDQYNIWLQSAEALMKEGIKSRYVLPKSLTVRVIPQFDALTTVK
jgi:uncharacterized protein (DUF885 family)